MLLRCDLLYFRTYSQDHLMAEMPVVPRSPYEDHNGDCFRLVCTLEQPFSGSWLGLECSCVQLWV